jgi:hypothetical protein
MEAARRNGRNGGKIMSSTRVDGRLLVRVAAQVEELQARVTELENRERTRAQTVERHSEQIEAIAKALDDDGEIEQAATLQ